MNPIIHILCLEDNPADAELAQAKLEEAGLVCRITRVQTYAEFDAALQQDEPDVILADYRLPKCDGMSALRRAQALRPEVPFIFVSGTMGEEAAIEGLTQGATDYVPKQKMLRIASAVERALQEAKNRRERKRAQEALRHSNDLLRAIIEAAPVAIIGLDLDGHVHSVWNPAAEKMLGWSAQEVVGRPLPSVPADRQEEFRGFREQIRKGLTLDGVEVIRQRSDGTPIDYSIYASPLHDAEGRISGNIAVLVDITERKQREEERQKVERQLRTIVENFPDFIARFDEQCRHVYVNPVIVKDLGLPFEQFIGKTAFDLNAPGPSGQNEALYAGVKQAFKEGCQNMMEAVWPTQKGDRIFEIRHIPELDERGKVVSVIGITRDITERKAAERERLANLRFFESMDKANQAIQRADDLKKMMKDLLDVVLSIFDCDRAFLLYPCDPESQTWTCPMERNKPEYPGVHELGLEMPMDPQVAETLRILLAADGPVTFGPGTPHALPEDVSKQFDIKCFMSMAIYPHTGNPWQFGIHRCSHAREWTDEEKRVFEAIGRRLTDGLTSLLMYHDLKERENQYRELADSITDVFFAMDADLKYTYWNKASENLTGIKAEDAIGKTIFEVFPDTKETRKAAAMYQDVLKKKQPKSFENEYRFEDKYFFFEINAYPTEDGISVFAKDITERKQAEAALKKSEARYVDLYENAPDMYASVNAQTATIEKCNQTLADILGRPKEEIIGRPVFEIYHPDCLDQAKEVFKEFLDLGEIHDKELQLRKKDGSKLDVSLNVSSVRDEDGHIFYSRSTLRDITERKAAERQVALMSFALNGVHEAAFLIDEKACFHYVNDEACRLLGYSRDKLLTMAVPDISPGFPMERWSGLWSNLKEHGAITFEGELKTKNSRIIPVEINANYFEYEGQSFDIGLVRDITERKQAERERLANLRFFESMDKVSRAIQSADDLEKMMQDLLDVVLSIFDCDRAYLRYPCDPKADAWTVPMERCKPEYPGAFALGVKVPMSPMEAEIIRILLSTDGPVKSGPGCPYSIPKDISERFGIKSFLTMALYPKLGKPWMFGLHQCAYTRTWTPEDVALFQEIGRRLSDSLSSLLSYRDLRNNEEFLNNIVEHIPNMIFVKDAQNLSFVRFNKAGEKLLGYSREELFGKTDYDFFPKEEADFFTTKDHQVLDSKELLDIPEEILRNRSNEERILHTKKIPILDETGAPQYLLGISEDITERKQADESIRKLSQAIEQSPVSIVITDAEGSIEFVNAKFTQVTGYTYNEAMGQNPRILKSGETSVEEYGRLWKTISSGGIWHGEFHNRKKNGELFWEHATIAPVRNADNIITHYVGVKEDITQRKELEEQFRQTQKMEAVGQLAGGVAHDFNNMLGVVIGHAQIALKKAAQDAPLRKHLEQILAASHHSAEITQQLLAFARKQTIAPKILELNETVERMLKLLRRLIGEDIDLVWVPGANLWTVKVDPAQVDQILANLCVNARDAIAGVGKVTIETQNAVFDDAYCAEHKGFSPGEYVMLAVSDNGSGMDKRDIDRIFEPFFTTKEIGKGTGLGLATVYGIVKQNAGLINAYSELGHGSTFKIYLPKHTVKTDQIDQERVMDSIARGSEAILLVEDEPAFLNIMKLMLENCGYAVVASSTPGEAVRIASEKSSEIDLLITDMVMPEMTGLDLEKKLKSLCPELKCLLMSGYTGNAIARHGVLDEGVNFIQKPFSIQELATKVREVLDSK